MYAALGTHGRKIRWGKWRADRDSGEGSGKTREPKDAREGRKEVGQKRRDGEFARVTTRSRARHTSNRKALRNGVGRE